MKSFTPDELKSILTSHKLWVQTNGREGTRAVLREAYLSGAVLREADLRGANLSGANLSGAVLSRANLRGADLREANLCRAVLSGADLSRANLRGADLREANLCRAVLSGAVLSGADLREANLSGADLSEAKFDKTTRLPTSETWDEYLTQVVPALLTAGGKSLQAIIDAKAWDCHSWENCPMAVAFGVHDVSQVPILLQPRAEQFIQFFDARLVPEPTVPAPTATTPTEGATP